MMNFPGIQNLVAGAAKGMAAQSVEGTSENGAVTVTLGADLSVRQVQIQPAVVDPTQVAALEGMVAEAIGAAIGQAFSAMTTRLVSMAGLGDMLDTMMQPKK